MMGNKLVIVPFDLELSKEITNGEVEGRIITRVGNSVRILCYDVIGNNYKICGLVNSGKSEGPEVFTEKGLLYEGHTDDLDLMLEIPEYLSFKDFKTPAGRYRRNYVLGKSYTVASIQKRISLNKMEIPESLKRLPPHIRGFESSIGSGFRSANGLYLTQHQKRYMIPYWRLKNSERTVTSGTGNIREYSKEADRNLRDLQTVQDNKIRTVQDLSSRLDELNQMTDSIRRELRAIQSSREDSETENVISEYLSIQSAFANAAVPIEMEGKFENRLDEIEENYPIEELIHQKESNSKKEKQLQKEIKNLQQASRRLSKLKKIQKR